MRFLLLLLTIPAVVVFLGAPRSVSAQWTHLPSDPNYVGIEFLKPFFTNDVNSSFATFTAYATFRWEVNGGLRVVGAIPFSRWDPDEDPFYGAYYDPGSEGALGNIYLGNELQNPDAHVGVDFGVWLPTSPDDKDNALIIGVVSDVMRWEGFFPDIWGFTAGMTLWQLDPRGFGARVRLGPALMVPTDEGDAELMGLYSAHFVYLGEQSEFSAGFRGRVIITEDELDFSERTMHELEMSGTLKYQQFRPGAHIRVPLDDGLFRDVIDVALGIHLGVALP